MSFSQQPQPQDLDPQQQQQQYQQFLEYQQQLQTMQAHHPMSQVKILTKSHFLFPLTLTLLTLMLRAF